MRSPKCKTDASGVSLVETEEAGLKVDLSPHPPMASEGFPKAIGALTPLKSLGGLGETPEEVKPQHGVGGGGYFL